MSRCFEIQLAYVPYLHTMEAPPVLTAGLSKTNSIEINAVCQHLYFGSFLGGYCWNKPKNL